MQIFLSLVVVEGVLRARRDIECPRMCTDKLWMSIANMMNLQCCYVARQRQRRRLGCCPTSWRRWSAWCPHPATDILRIKTLISAGHEKAVAVRNSLLEKFSGKFRRCWKIIPWFSGSAKCYPCQGLAFSGKENGCWKIGPAFGNAAGFSPPRPPQRSWVLLTFGALRVLRFMGREV